MKEKENRIREYKINEKTSSEWQKILDEVVSQYYYVKEQDHYNEDDIRICVYLVETDGECVEEEVYDALMYHLGIDSDDEIYEVVKEILENRVRCTEENSLQIFALTEIKFEITN